MREKFLKVFHKAHWSCHFSYLSLVFIEGHGLYRFAALGIAVTMLIAPLLGVEEEE